MKKKITILYILLFIFLAVGAVSLYVLFTDDREPAVMEQYDYNEIQEMVQPAPSPSPPSIDVPGEDPSESVPPEDTGAASVVYDPEELLAVNKDFRGWLYIPDTPISLPVVQSKDNDHYLNYSFTGAYSVFGCLFLDCDTPVESDNRVIHGHNMGRNRDEMFSPLINYLDNDFAASHNTFSFTEPGVEHDTYEIFAILHFDVNDLDEFDYTKATFNSAEERTAFIDYLRSKSRYDTDFIPEGQLLILSTCDGRAGTDIRLLVCAGKTAPDQVPSTAP